MKKEFELIENIQKDKELYIRLLDNTNIYKLRNSAAERGFEMTIEEIKKYMKYIRELCEDIT